MLGYTILVFGFAHNTQAALPQLGQPEQCNPPYVGPSSFVFPDTHCGHSVMSLPLFFVPISTGHKLGVEMEFGVLSLCAAVGRPRASNE